MTKKKRKSKGRHRSPATTPSATSPPQKRRLPIPKVTIDRAKEADRRPADSHNNPIVEEIVRLHRELCRVSQRAPLTIWRDWLDSTEPWLRLVGTVGEIGAMAGLPPEVQAIYDRLDRRYAQAAARHPSAHRKMGQTFTTIFRLLADAYALIDLERCGQYGQLCPDFLGQAFIASLGYPQRWLDFFPDWASCIEVSRDLVPDDGAEVIYTELARAHTRARLAGVGVATPQPGDDESWAGWLTAIRPYAELPILIGSGVVTSSSMLLALASRFPTWVVRNDLVRFVWPDIVDEPVLSKITTITAMLHGLNGFYAGKSQGNLAAIAQIEAAILEQAKTGPSPTRSHPSAIYNRLSEAVQAAPAEQATPGSSGHPSFAELFKRNR